MRYAQLLHLRKELRGDGRAADEIPVDVTAGEEDLVEHAGAGQVGHQHTEGDGAHQQRLKLLADTQVQQEAGDAEHDRVLPAAVLQEQNEAGIVDKIQDSFHMRLQSVTG